MEIPEYRLECLRIASWCDTKMPTHYLIEHANALFNWIFKDVPETNSKVFFKLNSIINKLDKIMAKQEQFDAMVQRLNVATNDIAADLKLLKDQIAAGTVSDESLAKLDADIAKLEALGASTENPVPPSEPTEPPVDNPQ